MTQTQTKLVVAGDHRSEQLIAELKRLSGKLNSELKVEFIFLKITKIGNFSDYPLVAQSLVKKMRSVKTEAEKIYGLLLCGSGIGMSLSANQFKGITASQLNSALAARQDRLEHDPNVLVIGVNEITHFRVLLDILQAWLPDQIERPARYTRRIKQLSRQERQGSIYGIYPALLTDDIADLRNQLNKMQRFAPSICIDILDDSFISGKTIDLEQAISEIESRSQQLFAIHLMTDKIEPKLRKLARLSNLHTVYAHLGQIEPKLYEQDWSFDIVPTINPDSEFTFADMLLYPQLQFMTVLPGAQGRGLESEVLNKIQALKTAGYCGQIHIDGGVNPESLPKILEKTGGVDVVNVGSALSNAAAPDTVYLTLKNQLQQYYGY